MLHAKNVNRHQKILKQKILQGNVPSRSISGGVFLSKKCSKGHLHSIESWTPPPPPPPPPPAAPLAHYQCLLGGGGGGGGDHLLCNIYITYSWTYTLLGITLE